MKINITDCHVHASLQTDMNYLSEFLKKTDTYSANIIACSDSRAVSLAPWALQIKKHSSDFYVYAAPDMTAYYLNQNNLGEYFANNAAELINMGCDGIKLLEGKPQFRKMLPVPDFDNSVWESFWKYAEEKQVPILWHVNDPENFWDRENAPSFAVSQGWLYDETYVNNEDQYRQVLTVLKRHPELRICFAHFFFMSAQLERLSGIFDEFPGVMTDITPGIEMYENFSADCEESREFFIKYHDRICYGTDIGGRCVLGDAEKNSFDEAENTRRPEIVRTFLESDQSVNISSDGHYIIGRPDFTMNCLNLPDNILEDIYHNNFVSFTGHKPNMLNSDAAIGYSWLLMHRVKLLEKYPTVFSKDHSAIEKMIISLTSE